VPLIQGWVRLGYFGSAVCIAMGKNTFATRGCLQGVDGLVNVRIQIGGAAGQGSI